MTKTRHFFIDCGARIQENSTLYFFFKTSNKYCVQTKQQTSGLDNGANSPFIRAIDYLTNLTTFKGEVEIFTCLNVWTLLCSSFLPMTTELQLIIDFTHILWLKVRLYFI